jgi:hypothetical protein
MINRYDDCDVKLRRGMAQGEGAKSQKKCDFRHTLI